MSIRTVCTRCGKEWLTPDYRRKPSDDPYECPTCLRAYAAKLRAVGANYAASICERRAKHEAVSPANGKAA